MICRHLNSSFFVRNRAKLKGILEIDSICILSANRKFIANYDNELEYKVNSNMYYFTGIEVPEVVFVMYYSKTTNNFEDILFIKHQSDKDIIWHGEGLSRDKAAEISGVENVLYLDELYPFLSSVANHNNIFYLAKNNRCFDDSYVSAENSMLADIKHKFPLHSYKNISPIVRSIRTIKENEEIELIRDACEVTTQAFVALLPKIQFLKYEFQIKAEIMHYLNTNGIQNMAYEPIIASGINSCILHYTKNSRKFEMGEVLLLDIGAEVINYSSDMTRVVPVSGKFSEIQKKYYEIVLDVLKKAPSHIVLGSSFSAFCRSIVDYLKDKMLEVGLIKSVSDDSYKNYFMHGISHHLGLDTHDDVCYDLPLQNGMVLAIEPALYIREYGFGVRLENTYVIENGSMENLCKNMPIEVEEIEYYTNL